MLLFEKKLSDTWELPIIELIKMVEKYNTFITINCIAFFILEFFIQSL